MNSKCGVQRKRRCESHAIVDYVIGLEKLSRDTFLLVLKWQQVCNRQLKVISGVSFITVHVAYAVTNKTRVTRIETELFSPGSDAPNVYMRAWTLCCLHSFIGTQTFRRALTVSVDSCAEMKSAPSVA